MKNINIFINEKLKINKEEISKFSGGFKCGDKVLYIYSVFKNSCDFYVKEIEKVKDDLIYLKTNSWDNPENNIFVYYDDPEKFICAVNKNLINEKTTYSIDYDTEYSYLVDYDTAKSYIEDLYKKDDRDLYKLKFKGRLIDTGFNSRTMRDFLKIIYFELTGERINKDNN